MVLDLLFETIVETAFDRRDRRTRFQTACLVSGFLCLLVGTWTAFSTDYAVGFAVAFVGSLLVLYGR